MRGTWVAVAGLVLATGCAGLPQTSRTAVIHEVKFEASLAPADLTVHVGDEIRWVNHRTLPVLIDIPGLNAEMLSCDRGFSGMMGGVSELKELDPSKSASLCFSNYACLFGAAALLPPALYEAMAGDLGRYSMPAWLSIAYLGFFGTCLGFVWYYEGIRQIGPSKAAVFINLVPISDVIMAFFLLGETIDASLLIGAALVLSGIYLTNRPAGN